MIEKLLIANAVGTAVQAVGQIQAGNDAKAAHDYNAQVQDRNAEAERINAERVEFIETAQVEKFRKNYKDFADAQRMAFSHNNVVSTSGSALAVQLDSAREAETEIANNIYNIKLGKQAREEAALNSELEGKLQRMYGKAAQRAGQIQAGTSLMSGAMNAYKIGKFA